MEHAWGLEGSIKLLMSTVLRAILNPLQTPLGRPHMLVQLSVRGGDSPARCKRAEQIHTCW